MRGVWATLISVWALFAILAVLAWTRQPGYAAPPASQTTVVKGKNGQLMVIPSSTAPHATTRTSPVPVG